jgi:hypothetical protein
MTRWLETDTHSNKDISTAVSVGVYTADADRLILVQVFADQVAGNGDYELYVTHQINGAGSSYRMIPITTAAAASGVTAIAAQSGMIAVRSGDVLTVYLDGLAGDNSTPDTTVRWFELAALRPTTADRTLNVSAGGVADADAVAISTDATAADNLETMLDGTGGAQLTLKKLVINNPDALGVGIAVNAYNGAYIEGTNRGMILQGGSNQALFMTSATASETAYIEGPTTGGKGLAISSPSDGSSLPGASAIYIQTEGGHPGILFDFNDPADAMKIVNSDNGNWVLDDKLFAAATDAAAAVRTELTTELAHLDADVSSAGSGLTAQETRDAMKLAPTAGAPAAGSVDAHLDSLLTYGTGTGTGTYTDTVTDGVDPLDNVLVQLSTDSAGANMAYRAYTGADGVFVMNPDPGTYYVWLELAGYSFTQGAEVTVT